MDCIQSCPWSRRTVRVSQPRFSNTEKWQLNNQLYWYIVNPTLYAYKPWTFSCSVIVSPKRSHMRLTAVTTSSRTLKSWVYFYVNYLKCEFCLILRFLYLAFARPRFTRVVAVLGLRYEFQILKITRNFSDLLTSSTGPRSVAVRLKQFLNLPESGFLPGVATAGFLGSAPLAGCAATGGTAGFLASFAAAGAYNVSCRMLSKIAYWCGTFCWTSYWWKRAHCLFGSCSYRFSEKLI